MSEEAKPSYMRIYHNLKNCGISEAMEFLRYFAVTLSLWLVGYMHFSMAWIVLIIMIFLMWQFELEKKKKHRKHLIQCHQSSYVNRMEGLPSWVYFSEDEQVEWLNKMLVQMWPYIGGMVYKILKENVEPELQKSLPKSLSSLYFETIDLGNTPPQFKNVVAYGKKSKDKKRSEDFIFDLALFYRGDANLKLNVKSVKLGISNIQLQGPLRVIFKPLVSEYNPVGGVTVFFLNRPQLKFDLNNLLNVLDFPGLKSTLRRIINDVIASFVVLPNRVVVPLAEGVDASDLQYPIPEGVLQIGVLEAKELTACDFGLVKKGKSDPYTVVQVGAQQFRTKLIKNNLNPEWNETFEAFIDNQEGQEIFLQVYDEDTSSKDTKIGFIETDIVSVVQEGKRNVWLQLQGVEQGRIHLQLNWLELSSSHQDLMPPGPPGTSVAVVIVKPISASALPVTKKPSLQSIFCEIAVGESTQNTIIAYGEKTEWKQALRFLVSDPEGQEVKIKVIEAKGNKVMGKMAIDIRSLLNKPDMTIQQTFPLEDSGEKSVIKCRFILRMLKAPAAKGATDVDGKTLQRQKVEVVKKRTSKKKDRPQSSTRTIPKLVVDGVEEDAAGHGSDASDGGSVYEGSIYDLDSSTLGEDLSIRGELELSVRYDHVRNLLRVTVESVKNLVSRDPSSRTNPFVRLYLLPDRSKRTRRRTRLFKGVTSAEFGETFEYAVGLDVLRERQIEAAVKSESGSFVGRAKHRLIGLATVNLSRLDLSSGERVKCELRKIKLT